MEDGDPIGAWRTADGQTWWEGRLGGARLLFTTRVGGTSRAPYDALNLGLHVGDLDEDVAWNRETFWRAAASGTPPPILADQVHGASVAVVGAADAGRGWHVRETAVPRTDALVTREAEVALGILVADCAPVALIGSSGLLAVAHAGWRGLAGGVLEATLARMVELGGGPAGACRAFIGPCIRGCCYEVGEEVWRRFPGACLAPADRPDARRLDLMAAVAHRLVDAGVPLDRIAMLGLCTACDSTRFFSHRRATSQGLATTGRMGLFTWR